jgi:hypothetical protein
MDELASLDQSTRERALERFRIIQPCLEQDTPLSLTQIERITEINTLTQVSKDVVETAAKAWLSVRPNGMNSCRINHR